MRRSFHFIILATIFLSISSFHLRGEVRYVNTSDALKIMEIVNAMREGEYGDRIVAAAKSLQGIPLGKGADNDSVGTLVVRLDSLSQREFIYLSIALAKTSQLTTPSLREFEKNLENVSRRKGVDEGFASQFLYGSDWIVDNVYRGNLQEMTEYIEVGNSRTKTLDYVSRHPELFPAMKDPSTADKIKVMESGYRSHRIPHLKKQSINNKKVKETLKNGDIILLSPMDIDFDIYDIGIVSLENNEPYLIHVSRERNEVGMDPYPLSRLFKNEGQHFYGFRWLRPIE